MDIRGDITPRPVDVLSFQNAEAAVNRNHITGLRIDNQVFLSDCSPADLFARYFHEVGHYIADKYSFESKDVLTPDQVKRSIPQPLHPNEVFIARRHIVDNASSSINNVVDLLPLAHSILRTFTKGKFNPHEVILHTGVKTEELMRLARNAKRVPGIQFDEGGQVLFVSTKEGRNNEVPAMAVERGCIQLLNNALNALRLYPAAFRTTITLKYDDTGTSHNRAWKIVERAYERNGWILPSAKDLYLETATIQTQRN